MARLSLTQRHTCLARLTGRLVTLPKKSQVDTRPGSLYCTSMALVQRYSTTFYHTSTGPTFASLSTESEFSHSGLSRLANSVMHTGHLASFQTNSRLCITSENPIGCTSYVCPYTPSLLCLPRSFVLGLAYVLRRGPWHGQLAIWVRKSDSARTHSLTLHNAASRDHKQMPSRQ